MFTLSMLLVTACVTQPVARSTSTPTASAQPTSAYVAQLSSPVRGLSPQEVDDLLNGRGAGYARLAELNRYPGPRHVLDLKQQLQLTDVQETEIQTVFKQMQKDAKQLGVEIVDKEKQLSDVFAGGSLSETDLSAQTDALGLLYGKLRAVHLGAHIKIKPFLTATQIAKYDELRGYADSAKPMDHMQHLQQP